MDRRHDVPCGEVLKKLCERVYRFFDEVQYERLSTISVSHLYNLRKTKTYGLTWQHFQKTRAKASTFALTRYTRVTWTSKKVSITSMQWMNKPNLKSWQAWRKSASNTWYRFWNRCSKDSLLGSLVFILTFEGWSTFEIMDTIVLAITDNQSADRLQQARQTLFKTIGEREARSGWVEIEGLLQSTKQTFVQTHFRIGNY